MEEKKCVNCGISHVPLYLGLDDNWHCADHVGLLLAKTKEENSQGTEKPKKYKEIER
ncbi:MAG: hypothetical protein LIO74_04035 [Ruminococcus sp.]|nr:hypothetical protein [Ruminococcus sp.]MCD7959601.1 hypothetical protein [Ruminococcus sp.]